MNELNLNCYHCERLCSVTSTSRVSPAMAFSTSSIPFYRSSFRDIPQRPLVAFAKKKNSESEAVLSPSITEEVFEDGGEDDELLDEDGDFDDEYFEEEAEPSVGDGAGGGGISLAGTAWDEKALEIAEEVTLSFDGELGIYAFRTQLNAAIQVRIERLTNKSGSPSMTDIEAFTTTYRKRLDEAEASGNIPGNITLVDLILSSIFLISPTDYSRVLIFDSQVSSPGVEKVVRVPQDLERFKDRNLYVEYVMDTGWSPEQNGIFRLISFDVESRRCCWGLADVRVNREKSGKGRPFGKKQKEWCLNTPFHSLR